MYFVKVMTRSSKGSAKGSPRQAVDYITDGHDTRRDPGYGDAELAYIARMGDGWKTEMEGGRVPLVGLGTLAGLTDEKGMVDRFEAACIPGAGLYRPTQATPGYKSLTFTLPKEVSLYSEGHREHAKAAMVAAARAALDAAYPGKEYAGVGAIHTRNEAGEIHFHLHVLVGKFAGVTGTEKQVSLNSKAGGNGPALVSTLKKGWKDGVDREFKERLGLAIEQRTANSSPALVLPGGTRLDPLNRESRRLIEKEIAPLYAAPAGGGRVVVQRQLHLNAMDDRIYEMASGARGKTGWDRDAFERLFPDQARFVGRHEKRVETLKQIGYLTEDGRPTPEFRIHFAVKHGVNTPELQRLRIDLANRAARDDRRASGRAGRPATRRPTPAPALWEALDRYQSIRKRAERLGFTRDDLRRIHEEAEKRKPTRERLAAIRARVEKQVALAPPRNLPETKGIIRAFTSVQGMRLQRLYLLTEAVATLGVRYRRNKEIADRLKKCAERDLFYAKEKRLAQLGRGLRPMFWAVRFALPKQARRIEKAIERCGRLAYHQETQRVYRQEVTRAYQEWRHQHIEQPRADLKREAEALARPEQSKAQVDVARAAKRIEIGDLAETVQLFKAGREVLERLRPDEAAHLHRWKGNEEALVAEVVAAARREPHSLGDDERKAGLKAGRIGSLLERERTAPAPEVPRSMAAEAAAVPRIDARLAAFGITSPFTGKPLKSVPAAAVRKAIVVFEKAGLLRDGPEWTLAATAAREAAAITGPMLQRERDMERVLIDRLIAGRGRP